MRGVQAGVERFGMKRRTIESLFDEPANPADQDVEYILHDLAVIR